MSRHTFPHSSTHLPQAWRQMVIRASRDTGGGREGGADGQGKREGDIRSDADGVFTMGKGEETCYLYGKYSPPAKKIYVYIYICI